jgi:hypothetical protein
MVASLAVLDLAATGKSGNGLFATNLMLVIYRLMLGLNMRETAATGELGSPVRMFLEDVMHAVMRLLVLTMFMMWMRHVRLL